MTSSEEPTDSPTARAAYESFRNARPELVVPDHLAIIPDGNRRWADREGLAVHEGHVAGYQAAKKLATFVRRIGIHTLTIWGFSTENWKRPPEQVAALMQLFEDWIIELLPEALEQDVRFVHLGRFDGLPQDDEVIASAHDAGFPDGLPGSLKEAIVDASQKTRHCTRNTFNLALNYGGLDEVDRAFARMKEAGTGEGVLGHLDTAGQQFPNPDLILRTSGESRTSGLMPLQSVYAEMVFIEKYFPEVGEPDLVDVVKEFSRRKRNFGA